MADPGRRRRRRRNDEWLLTLAAARRLGRDRGKGRSTFAVVAITLLVVGLAIVAGVTVATATVVRAAFEDCSLAGRTMRPVPATSFVYARNGYLLGAIPAPLHRQPIAYQAMSPWIRDATVAAEDRTFWSNDGLDYASIARAALADLSAGRAVQGASTITQQLTRNLYLSDDKTFARKRLEACLALKLTKQLPKAEILTLYLNRIPYGHHALGIEAAARTYFGVPASRLGPDQAALLAGLPQAPSEYDPFANPQAALARRNEVLRAMRVDGALRADRYRRLIRRPLGLHPGHGYRVLRMPNFFDYVESQLVRRYGRSEVENGGLRVYTTLDPRAESIATNTMRDTLGRPGDPASALVSIDPHSGAIRAMASSWHGHELQFDLPADGARQTGSAFKPFVLTDAIWLHHADPATTWYDSSKFTYQPTPLSKPWTPRTYENRYFGPETLLKATLLSDNVVYAKLTLDVGPASVARVAHLMGISSRLDVVPSIGLGSNSVTPLVLASAYATLASGGVYHEPYAIRKVVLGDGRVDPRNRYGPHDVHRVLPPGVAWTVTKVLQANVREGTGVRAQLPGRDAAGKTGTTTSWTDAWFAGYVPSLTTVTWVGYPLHPRSMSDVHGIQVQGGASRRRSGTGTWSRRSPAPRSGSSTAAAGCSGRFAGRAACATTAETRLHSAAVMAGERTKLTVTNRDRLGSAESRRLRREGLIPGVLYGNGEPVAICIAERELRRALTGAAGLHSILDVEIDGKGETHASILKEYQVHPVRGGVTHVDLQEVRLDKPIQASVSVQLQGGDDAPGVREGGVLSQPLREVRVEALPLEVPEHLELDVSGMEIGGTLRISDLSAPEGVTLLDDPEMVVATVTAPTKVVEPEPTEEELAALKAEGEGAAGEAAEGEAAEGGAESEGESSGDEGDSEG